MAKKTKIEKFKRILVTGSSGMLGTDLCEELARNYHIVGLDLGKPVSQLAGEPVDFIQCDITDKDKTIKSIDDTKTDLVIHAAAWTDVDGCEKEPAKAEKINIAGTENIVNACSDLEILLIYISTDFVFDGNKKEPYTEKDIPNPISVYGKSKFEAEEKVKLLKKYIILRTSWLYGANGNNFVDTILKKAIDGEELRVVDDQIGSPTYTKDLAKALQKLLNITMDDGRWTMDEMREIYHVSNRGEVSWFEYAREILKVARINNVKLIPIKSNQLDRPAKRPTYSVLDNAKFEKDTNLSMRNWQEALTEYIYETRYKKVRK